MSCLRSSVTGPSASFLPEPCEVSHTREGTRGTQVWAQPRCGGFVGAMGQRATARDRSTKRWEDVMRGWKARRHGYVHLCLEDQLLTQEGRGTLPIPFDLFLFLSLAPLLQKPGSETQFLPFWSCLLPMPFTSAHLSSEGSFRENKAETQKNLSSSRMAQLQSLVNFQLDRN